MKSHFTYPAAVLLQNEAAEKTQVTDFISGSHPSPKDVCSSPLPPLSLFSSSCRQYLSLRKYGKLNWIFLSEMLWNYKESKDLEIQVIETYYSQYSYKAVVWTAGP